MYKMLLIKSSPTSVFMGSTVPYLESPKGVGDMRTELNPPIRDSERSVHNISIHASSNPKPSLSLFRDSSSSLGDSEGRSDAQDNAFFSAQPDPYGMPLLGTPRGCRPHAHVFESENISAASGSERGERNCEAPEDENSKSSRDMYYQKMLEANPGNPLLLSNYAKFLYQVQQNIAKADEYYGRAILANPGDAEVLSLYANFVWETHKDAARAKVYFDQAVKAVPDNCYILSAYAHFLWEAGEDEETEDDEDGSVYPHTLSASTCVGSINNDQ